MNKRIDFIVKTNEYDSTRYFARGLGRGLRDLGYDLRFLNFDPLEIHSSLQTIWDDPPDLTCSFSDITFGGKKPIAELLQLPHLSLTVDPVIYFLHQTQSSNSFITYVDEQDSQILNGLGFKNHAFLPHGADEAFIKDPRADRPYEIVFFGSCIDYEGLEQKWKKDYPQFFNLIQKTCQKVLSKESKSLFNQLIETLKEEGINLDDVPLIILHHEIDQYIRGYDRIQLLNALKDHPIHIWGNQSSDKGWSYYLKGCENVSVSSSIDFRQTIEIMQRSKIVLNSSPRFRAGSHERVFYGAAAGAFIITSASDFLNQNFPEAPYITYYPAEWEMLQDALEAFSSMRRCTMASNFQSSVLQSHTWAKRAQNINRLLSKPHYF